MKCDAPHLFPHLLGHTPRAPHVLSVGTPISYHSNTGLDERLAIYGFAAQRSRSYPPVGLRPAVLFPRIRPLSRRSVSITRNSASFTLRWCLAGSVSRPCR